MIPKKDGTKHTPQGEEKKGCNDEHADFPQCRILIGVCVPHGKEHDSSIESKYSQTPLPEDSFGIIGVHKVVVNVDAKTCDDKQSSHQYRKGKQAHRMFDGVKPEGGHDMLV